VRRSVEVFDGAVDRWLARFRGRRPLDRAAYVASWLGDHGLVWFLLGMVVGWRPGPRRALAVRAVVFTGAVTPVVNATVKRTVGRVRPTRSGSDEPPVRIPVTSSFPSGHALAAWCAATLFADDVSLAPACYATAVAISVSRAHVRLHHASDVVGGAFLGVVLGRVGRRVAPVGGRLMARLECTSRARG
jgi:membrane-associated phospholipid phosphatase